MNALAYSDLSSPRSDRRGRRRLACDLDLVDSRHDVFRAENIAVHGIKYSGKTQPPSGPHTLSLRVPGSGASIHVVARPVWTRRRNAMEWEVGARLEASERDRMRLQYLVNALHEQQELHDLRFVALSLLDRPAALEAIVRDVSARQLPAIVERAARAVRPLSPRPRYLWQYAYAAIAPTTLSSVAPHLVAPLTTLKVCASILFTAIDDIADEVRDPALYRRVVAEVFHGARPGTPKRPEACASPQATRATEQDRVLRHLRALWRFIRQQARSFPRGPELMALFEFDVLTLVHGMGHSLLANSLPDAICDEEQRRWTVSSFYMAAFADLDLMCSPELRVDEHGAIREIVWHAQEMCAIANWVGTWEREVRVGDYSSGFVATALRNGTLGAAELRAGGSVDTEALVERLRTSDVEASLLARWERNWRVLDGRRERIATFDVGRYLAGLERYLQLQLASRGLV